MSDDTYPEKNKSDPADAAAFPVGGAVVSGEPEGADEPMTEVQAAKLRELTEKAGEPFDGNLTRAQAQERIAALEEQT